jgi:hypothetical protein
MHAVAYVCLMHAEAYVCSRYAETFARGARVFGARVMSSLLEAWQDFCLFLLLSFSVEFLLSLRHRIQKGCGEAWQSMGMVKLSGQVLLTSEHFSEFSDLTW